MIVYQATKSDFTDDVFEDRIETKILDFFKKQNVIFEFKPLFDKSIGTAVVREYFENKGSKDELLVVCNNHLKKIVAQIQTVVLYEPALRSFSL